jgi:hypothetical protein
VEPEQSAVDKKENEIELVDNASPIDAAYKEIYLTIQTEGIGVDDIMDCVLQAVDLIDALKNVKKAIAYVVEIP